MIQRATLNLDILTRQICFPLLAFSLVFVKCSNMDLLGKVIDAIYICNVVNLFFQNSCVLLHNFLYFMCHLFLFLRIQITQ